MLRPTWRQRNGHSRSWSPSTPASLDIGLMTRCWTFWPISDYAEMNSRQGASRQGGTSQLGVIVNPGKTCLCRARHKHVSSSDPWNSFDGRYYGPVHESDMIGVFRP